MKLVESHPASLDPLGIEGIEFIEFATSQPLALGALLERAGFRAVARHRSREVVLYRQGDMNLVVDAHPQVPPGLAPLQAVPRLSGFALRVRDAGAALRRTLEMGAWEAPSRAAAMELNVPAIRGAGDSLVHFVDRRHGVSLLDIDFVPLEGVDPAPPAVAGLHWFGLVQAVHADRRDDWTDFYRTLLGFRPLPEGRFFGVLPKGALLRSPCHRFYIQLIEPPEGAEDAVWDEGLLRIGLGTPDVPRAVEALRARGLDFVDHGSVQPSDRGALSHPCLGGVCFELVVSRRDDAPGASRP